MVISVMQLQGVSLKSFISEEPKQNLNTILSYQQQQKTNTLVIGRKPY